MGEGTGPIWLGEENLNRAWLGSLGTDTKTRVGACVLFGKCGKHWKGNGEGKQKGRQPAKAVRSSQRALWVTGLYAAEKLWEMV